MAVSTVFATWFGSETILGASAEMADGGLLAVIEEPFGASLCLVLVGLFFAKPLYRKGYLAFADFYRDQFGKNAERIASICLVLSYLGWIAAQMVAMGIVLSKLSGLEMHQAILLTSLVVIIYTFLGGMWAVSVTDSFQMILIVTGLLFVLILTLPEAGGLHGVVSTAPEKHFQFFPGTEPAQVTAYLAAWATLGLGSIPQQDVFQRVMASKDEKVASRSAIIAGVLYLTVAMIPLLMGMIARKILPGVDKAELLPTLIINHTGTAVQVFFFGALLSAIMSTASGALLAPSAIVSENLVKPYIHHLENKTHLLLNRLSVVLLAIVSLGFALVEKNVYELVSEASALSLVSLFVPLVAGLFLKSKNELSAILSMVFGITTWLIANSFDTTFPPIFIGLLFSLAGFLIPELSNRFRSSKPFNVNRNK